MEFKPARQNRIAVEIVNQLKRAILSGKFKAGDRMPSERELTERFQVSRVVVREAIRELEIKGFVKILQGQTGGAYVTDLSFERLGNAFLDLFLYNKLSVAELIRTRIVVECEIVQLAAAHVDSAFSDRLQAALLAEGSGGLPHLELISKRLLVHHILAEMSANRMLQAVASSLYQLTGEIILEVKPIKEIIHKPEEHAEIVRAVLAADPEASRAAMKRHLDVMGKKLIRLEGVYRERKGLTI